MCLPVCSLNLGSDWCAPRKKPLFDEGVQSFTQIKRMKWDESSFKVPNMITYDEGISFSIPKHSTRNFNITSNLYWHPNVS